MFCSVSVCSYICVCACLFQNNMRTICECIIKSIFIGPRSIAEVPLSSGLPYYLLHTTFVRSCCTWRASCVAALKKKNWTEKKETRPGSGASGLPYYCTPFVCIPAVIGLLAVWRHNKPKKTKKTGQRSDIAAGYKKRKTGKLHTGRTPARWPL